VVLAPLVEKCLIKACDAKLEVFQINWLLLVLRGEVLRWRIVTGL